MLVSLTTWAGVGAGFTEAGVGGEAVAHQCVEGQARRSPNQLPANSACWRRSASVNRRQWVSAVPAVDYPQSLLAAPSSTWETDSDCCAPEEPVCKPVAAAAESKRPT